MKTPPTGCGHSCLGKTPGRVLGKRGPRWESVEMPFSPSECQALDGQPGGPCPPEQGISYELGGWGGHPHGTTTRKGLRWGGTRRLGAHHSHSQRSEPGDRGRAAGVRPGSRASGGHRGGHLTRPTPWPSCGGSWHPPSLLSCPLHRWRPVSRSFQGGLWHGNPISRDREAHPCGVRTRKPS